MEELKYLFIINPISGDVDKSVVIDFLASDCINKQYKYLFHRTTGDNDREVLSQYPNRFNIENIIAIGGDGTLNLAVSTFHRHNVNFGIIPLGSANGMSRELFSDKGKEPILAFTILERVRHYWEIIEKQRLQKIDAISINNEYHCLHLGDIGLNAKIVKRFEENRMRGYWGYARQFFKEFYHKSKLKYKISIDDARYKGKAYMIVIANAARYGNGAMINPAGKLDDGQFELCIVKTITFRSLIRSMKSIFSDNISYLEKEITILPCRHATIKLKKPQPFQVDGEVIGDVQQVDVSIIPGFLNMIS